MPALTFAGAIHANSARYIEVGGRMIGLRPSSLYSLSGILYQIDLLNQYPHHGATTGPLAHLAFRHCDQIPFASGAAAPARSGGNLRDRAVTEDKLLGMPQRHLRRIIREGQAYLAEGREKGAKSEEDLGVP